jgi:aspartate/tyrosine/aromatic aminotransferase
VLHGPLPSAAVSPAELTWLTSGFSLPLSACAGLYNERAGTISFVCSSSAQAKAVLSQVKMVIRPNYSNPPAHGARIVKIVLSDPALYAEWKEELKGMSGRINAMRKELRAELEKSRTPGDWSHITSQIGMFSFTGLTAKQSAAMAEVSSG